MRPLLLHRPPSRVTLADLAHAAGRDLEPPPPECDDAGAALAVDPDGGFATVDELLAALDGRDEDADGASVEDGRALVDD